MGRFAVLLVLLGFFAAQAARADTAFYVSKPEVRYGVCYGCGPDARRIAQSECARGGTACTPVLYCAGGWAAVAQVSEGGGEGIGLACGYGTAFAAELAAVTNCIATANWYCHPIELADPQGNLASVGASNSFSVTFLTQAFLQLADYSVSISDVMTPQTIEALSDFQRKTGRPATGEPNMTEIWYLQAGGGGRQLLFDTVRTSLVEPDAATNAPYVYAYAPARMPDVSFGNELMAMDEASRLLAVATHLAAMGHPCSKATSAAPPFGAPDELWLVSCPEADYSVMMYPDGQRTVISTPK